MNCLISLLTRKQRGGILRKDEEVSTDVLRLGRGADCEVHLADPRVLLHHAQILGRPGGFFIEAVGQGELLVNGAATQAAKLKAGDRIGVGPYEITVAEAPEGTDLALSVELVRPLGDDLAQLKARSRTSLSAVGLSKRGWSWLLFLAVAAVFLALPLYAYMAKPDAQKQTFMAAKPASWPHTADSVWISGEISGPHKFFGASCEACHQTAFVQVKDEACLSCHATVQHHADPAKFQMADFSRACESCHKEHNGIQAIVMKDQAFCADCHADLEQRATAASLLNTADFGTAHPQFRPAVMTDPASGRRERVAIDAAPKPTERSNLKFPHDKHLVDRGVRHPDKGPVKLDCGGCHAIERGGIGLQPIAFETHCQECHSLRFDAAALDRELPHAEPAEALQVLRDFFAARVLRGGVEDQDAPPAARRRPGQPLAEAERLEALAWADRKAVETGDRLFGRSLCGSCHETTGGGGEWQVAKVAVVDRWMPKGKFVHDKHAPMACGDCHAAAKSESASDVLLPGIAVCQTCHGGEKATAQVPSTCIDCHEFHRPELAPMRSPASTTTAGG